MRLTYLLLGDDDLRIVPAVVLRPELRREARLRFRQHVVHVRLCVVERVLELTPVLQHVGPQRDGVLLHFLKRK